MTTDQLVRENLKALIRGSDGESYSSVSRLLGRNAAYVHQYMTRGTPERLDERDRKLVARYFGVDEDTLGKANDLARLRTVQVRCLSVQAAAGAGRFVNGEFAIGAYGFDPAWLRRVCRTSPENLSIITVSGDSMSPTLTDGDDVLVDQSDAGGRLRDGIYVLRRDDTLMVKRLALAPSSGTLTIASDNTAYPTWRDCALDSVDVIGRVVWSGRKFG